jgi:uncharacterized Zn ribbon protein
MLYLEPEVLSWAESSAIAGNEEDETEATVDNNGAKLAAGDTVTLIKDLLASIVSGLAICVVHSSHSMTDFSALSSSSGGK